LRAAKKAAAKRHRAQVKKQNRKVKKQEQKTRRPKLLLEEKLELLAELIRILIRNTYGKVHFRVRSFRISVGTDNAAKTAILYGVVAESAACILEVIDKQFVNIQYDVNAVSIVPNFVSEKSATDIDFELSVSIFKALRIYQRVLDEYRRAEHQLYKRIIEYFKQERLAMLQDPPVDDDPITDQTESD
jgi:hypothetical protein